MPPQDPTPSPDRRPGRRAVLALITTGMGVGALAACSAPPAGLGRRLPEPTRDDSPDTAARARAITWARHLRDRGMRERGGAASSRIDEAVSHHLLHLSALGDVASAVPGGPSPVAPLVPPRTTPAITPRPAAGAAALAADEARAAASALESCVGTSPGLATLLARIAAARCVHAVRLDGPGAVRALVALDSAPTPPGTDAAALQDMLAGAHAALYAYGFVVARSSGAQRVTARGHAAEHERTVELLQRLLREAGVEPVASLPGYLLPDLRGTDAAARLARRVESGTARLAAAAVGATGGEHARGLAARLLARSALRGHAWGDRPALPGA